MKVDIKLTFSFPNMTRKNGARANTDHARGKNYFTNIQRTYKAVGFTPSKVQRIWVTWVIPDEELFEKELLKYCRSKRIGRCPIQVVSFRDEVLPKLLSEVRKSNYDDDVLRTLSLLNQFKRQRRALAGEAGDFD
jgi:hypothetical protein